MKRKTWVIIILGLLSIIISAITATYMSGGVLDAFDKVNAGLTLSSEFEKSAADSIYNELGKYKANDTVLYTRVIQLRQICKMHVLYIDSLKSDIITQSGGIDSSSNQVIKRDDINIGKRLVLDNGAGETLFSKRIVLKNALLNVCNTDSCRRKIENIFKGEKDITAYDWSNKTFSHTPVVAVLTILSKFKNDCVSAEKEVLRDLLQKPS